MSSLKTGVELHFLVWNRVRIWRTGRHTPTKNSQEYPLLPASGLKSQTFLNSDRPNVRAEARETFAKRTNGSDEVARLVTLKKLSRSVEKVYNALLITLFKSKSVGLSNKFESGVFRGASISTKETLVPRDCPYQLAIPWFLEARLKLSKAGSFLKSLSRYNLAVLLPRYICISFIPFK